MASKSKFEMPTYAKKAFTPDTIIEMMKRDDHGSRYQKAVLKDGELILVKLGMDDGDVQIRRKRSTAKLYDRMRIQYEKDFETIYGAEKTLVDQSELLRLARDVAEAELDPDISVCFYG